MDRPGEECIGALIPLIQNSASVLKIVSIPIEIKENVLIPLGRAVVAAD
jgi:hypothetical protein